LTFTNYYYYLKHWPVVRTVWGCAHVCDR